MYTKYKSKTSSSYSKRDDSQNSAGEKKQARTSTKKPLQRKRANSNAKKTTFIPKGGGGEKLKVIVLGGLEQVGINMTVLEYGKEIITIDMGLMFPDEDMPGIDYIIPNTAYLEERKEQIKGAIITHGHMDHIGAIPHLMSKLNNPPMFMGKLTAGLVRKRMERYRGVPKISIREINDESVVQLGKNFRIEFLRVNHSIPDSFAIIIHTPVGTVVHTGDFKIDYTPVNDKPADLNRIALIGQKGVKLLMSDSTDSTHPGYQVSESYIGDEISKILDNVEGRLIIGTFASQLSRIQKIFDIAEKHNRRIFLEGRTMNDNVEIAHQIGYLKFDNKILLDDAAFRKTPDNKLVIIGTGAQGETNAFLSRVVSGEHKFIRLKKGDTVIFSSSVIPGNERSIQNLMDKIVRQGSKIINYKMMDVHAGGHAKQEDLKLMMRLLKPEYFMPIEGSHYMLSAHAELASQVGIPNENIFVADNGQIIEFEKNSTRPALGKMTNVKVPTDYVMVDGLGVGDISNIVLRDRRVMAEDGMIVVITTIDSKTGDPIGNPDIISRGFVYMKENRELIEKTRMKVKKMIKDHDPRTPADDELVKNKIRNEIGQFLFGQTKRRPMVLPVIIKV